MRKLIDRLADRLGFVRWSNVVQGEIEWRMGEPVHVDLKVPGGQRVVGFVDSGLRL
ncbi:hypothetical protein SEA_CHRIS_37 [Mycobacterium phage Chris]|uniref:Uncharacterized protein n=1 Tax=Mycobacterium phage Chris TaxID=2725626 RepID=A0A6M3SXT1_9CAUD|nr:hypothetical protein I5G96_gp068 [Mycobacterium phage Chris]QJD50439.1 hypothetical protein SEA_CHRIS_37 [Mycobacterium phage Chris]